MAICITHITFIITNIASCKTPMTSIITIITINNTTLTSFTKRKTPMATSACITVSIASQTPSKTCTTSSTATIATTSTATIATSTIRRTFIATAIVKSIFINDFLFWNIF